MAFLDRLVSDLIRNSTGFNARPFVRAVGGKNILLMGGAAIAAAVAADKMKGSAPKGPPPVPTTKAAPPPPPPIPKKTPPIPPPPPPLPTAAPDNAEQADGEASLPNELVFAIVRTMVAGALADGQVHDKEKALIEDRLGESGLTQEQIKQVHKDLLIPASPETLAASVQEPGDRDLLYRFGVLVAQADGEMGYLEETWLAKLAAALSIDDERAKSLRAEIFEQ